MKIELELPDWCDERHIYILAGIELAAYKHADGEWKIKDKRCVQCGDCCKGHKPNNPHMEIDPNGSCVHLLPDGKKLLCGKAGFQGFNCITSDPVKDRWKTHRCSITYK